jgi:hypothetical protein
VSSVIEQVYSSYHSTEEKEQLDNLKRKFKEYFPLASRKKQFATMDTAANVRNYML